MKKTAADYFKGPEKYNCAQAVFKGFQEEYDVPEAFIRAHKMHGHGKAPCGVCGAAYAAVQLLATQEEREQFNAAFEKQAGSLLCAVIRTRKTVSCKDAVALAESILRSDAIERESTHRQSGAV
jgi:hypothetical protein